MLATEILIEEGNTVPYPECGATVAEDCVGSCIWFGVCKERELMEMAVEELEWEISNEQ